MRTTIRLAALLSTLALAACGGGGSDPVDAPGGTPDAPAGTPDAIPLPDADLTLPDAAVGAFTCLGVPIPTTAPGTVNVGGTMAALGVSGSTPIVGATVEGFIVGNPTAVASTTTATGGAYTLAITNPGTAPINGYLRSASTNNKTVYLFPPTPIYADIPMAPLRTIPNNLFAAFLSLANATVGAGEGVVALVVTDCQGNPLQGAVVTSTAVGADVRYNGTNGLPSGSATATAVDGVAYVAGIPAGNVTVDATYQSMDLREHSVAVYPADGTDNAITTTTVQP